jgi:putative LysE/RhtB family amino acid efflux pump
MLVAFLVGLGLGFLGSIPTAGPTSIVVLDDALKGERRHGMYVAFGGALAESLYAFLAFAGFTAAVLRLPALMWASRLVGGVLVAAVGVYLVVGRRKATSATPSRAGPTPLGRRWAHGFGSAILNPTLFVTWTSIVGVLHATSLFEMHTRDALPFALGVGLGVLGWFAVLIKVARRFRARLTPIALARALRGAGWVMIAMGAVLAGRALLRMQS